MRELLTAGGAQIRANLPATRQGMDDLFDAVNRVRALLVTAEDQAAFLEHQRAYLARWNPDRQAATN